MRPSDMTTGVKPRPTPNGLNSIVISPLSSATGTGNSPPARNFADSPEIAVSVGSARVRSKPSRSMARMTASEIVAVVISPVAAAVQGAARSQA